MSYTDKMSDTPSSTDLHNLLDFASQLAHQAGDVMRRYFHADDQHVQTKDNDTPLTVADTTINRMVIEAVSERFPEHGVLGEEDSNHSDRDQLWVCDPIDGTRSFIVGEPTAMFSLAYVVNGRPLVAVAYDPFQDRLYTAIKDEGAFCDGHRLSASKCQLADSTVLQSGSVGDIRKRWDLYERLHEQGVKVRFMGGGVFKACLVAEGRADGYMFPGRGAHDIAAVKLLVEEAGGIVTDLHGNEQPYDRPIRGAIIANAVIHQELVAAVRQFGVDTFIGF